MSSVWDINFIVVDVETTGSQPAKDRMTEVACVHLLGGEIIDEFSSLLNPHQTIPAYIEKMTGISNALAFTAPEADEVMPKVMEFFSKENCVFVAHNSQFDYSFVEQTFLRCGIESFDFPKLCTLKLSRRLLNSKLKKNVGSLAHYFGIPIQYRHRALGDAKATAQILAELLEIAEDEHNIQTIDELLKFQNKPIKHFKPPTAVIKRLEKILDELPDHPGVYYFKNRYKDIIYVGKAKSIRERVRTYFQSESLTSTKINEMVNRIYYINWQPTDSELSALLLESSEIKRHKPRYNVVSKMYRNYKFIKLTTEDKFPVITKCNSIDDDLSEYYGPFRSNVLIDNTIETIERQFKLRKCGKPINTQKLKKPCIYYQMGMCLAPCSNSDSEKQYNDELCLVREFLSTNNQSIITNLEIKMRDLAENLEFEEAAFIKNQIYELKKILNRNQNVPTSINQNNVILVQADNEREKTVDITFIKEGRLANQVTLGRKADLDELLKSLHDIYYNGTKTDSHKFSLVEIDEIKIVSSWLYRQRDNANFIYVQLQPEEEIAKQLEYSIRNVIYHDEK